MAWTMTDVKRHASGATQVDKSLLPLVKSATLVEVNTDDYVRYLLQVLALCLSAFPDSEIDRLKSTLGRLALCFQEEIRGLEADTDMQTPIDKSRRDFDEFEQSNEFKLALFMAYTEYCKVVLSSLFLMNGGAAVAMLAFLGAGRDPSALIVPEEAKFALIAYISGVALAISATALAMLTEFVRHHTHSFWPRVRSLYVGILGFIVVVASVLAFSIGCLFAARVL